MTQESINGGEEVKGEEGVPIEPQQRMIEPKDLVIDDLTRQVAQKALELADVRAQLVISESQMSQAHLINQNQAEKITELQAIVSTLDDAITEDIQAEDVEVEESPIKG